MTVYFLDSFEHSTTLTQKYSTVGTNLSISTGGGRTGSNYLTCSNAQASAGAKITFGSEVATIYVGAAFRIPSQTLQADGFIFRLYNAAGTMHGGIGITSSLIPYFFRGTSTGDEARTTVESGANGLSQGVWYFGELKLTVNDSTGVYEFRVNETVEIEGSSTDTRNNTSGNSAVSTIGFSGGTNASNAVRVDIDDIYICDTSFLGDGSAECLFPTGVGNYAQFSRGGSDSGANWSQVEETVPNDDTDYNQTSTINNIDSFAFGNLTTTSGVIRAVQHIYRVKKDAAGTRAISTFSRINSTDYVGTSHNLASSYEYWRDVVELSPDSGSAWTVSEINASEFGYKLTS